MKTFCIWLAEDETGEAYWLQAESDKDARRLLALNVSEAAGAEDAAKFECHPDKAKSPPAGFIHRRLYGPVAIERV
jgi:hypothetical protein